MKEKRSQNSWRFKARFYSGWFWTKISLQRLKKKHLWW